MLQRQEPFFLFVWTGYLRPDMRYTPDIRYPATDYLTVNPEFRPDFRFCLEFCVRPITKAEYPLAGYPSKLISGQSLVVNVVCQTHRIDLDDQQSGSGAGAVQNKSGGSKLLLINNEYTYETHEMA